MRASRSGLAAYLLRGIAPRLQPIAGIICFIAIVAACSNNLRAVNWRTVGWGIALQLGLALFILKLSFNGWRPGYVFFNAVAGVVKKFLEFTNAGSQFVFGPLANVPAMDQVFGPGKGVIFAFKVLPTIIFIAALFAILYYFGMMQFVVRAFRGRDAPRDAGERRRIAQRRRQHLHGPDRGAADDPAVPAADDRVRADDAS